MHRILFLCMGNICRSPAGHCVLQHMVDEAGLADRFEIESAGTIGFHVGSPPDSRMQQVMRARGIPVVGQSRQLKASDLREYDLILAMDNDNLFDAQALDPEGLYHKRSGSSVTIAPSTVKRRFRIPTMVGIRDSSTS